jgi:hypothetical protein
MISGSEEEDGNMKNALLHIITQLIQVAPPILFITHHINTTEKEYDKYLSVI